jgi:hypothetical protein
MPKGEKMSQERFGALGYLALAKETVKGTAVIPTDPVPLYKETMTTDLALQELTPAVGTKFKRSGTAPGIRIHKGTLEVMAEPNTAAKIFDMLLTQGTESGTSVITHPFTLDNTTNPNSYTVDISMGNQVFRFMGVEASKIAPNYSNNEMRLTVTASALGAFSTREIATYNSGNPNTITFKTDYDPAPNKGLVAGDLIKVTKANGVEINSTIVAVNADGVTITCTGTLSGVNPGDLISLRSTTQNYNDLALNPFLWANTQFCFGATVAAALAASQTRIEQSSTWEVEHTFESDNGAQRSGSFDPAALVRTFGDVTGKIKKYFDSPVEVNNFLARKSQALVIRHFVYSAGNTYELRIVIDQAQYKDGGKPGLESDKVLYHEFTILPSFNITNGEGMSVVVINDRSVHASASSSASPSNSPSNSPSLSPSHSLSPSSSVSPSI